MARLIMFASIREAAGAKSAEVDGETVADVLAAAEKRFGSEFQRLLPYCSVLLAEEPASMDASVTAEDEVALLPPVSGG